MCITNKRSVLEFLPSQPLVGLLYLNRHSLRTIIKIFRERTLLALNLTRRHYDFASEQKLVFFPKTKNCIFNTLSSLSLCPKFDLTNVTDLQMWIKTYGVQNAEGIAIKYMNFLHLVHFNAITYKLHFEKVDVLDNYLFNANLSFGIVKVIILSRVPEEPLQITNKSSVEEISIRLEENKSLAFILEFKNLRKLIISDTNNTEQVHVPRLFLPSLESLTIEGKAVIALTNQLREQIICNVEINYELVEFIAEQVRLTRLVIFNCTNVNSIKIPSSVKELLWLPIYSLKDKNEHTKKFSKKLCGLQLRKLKTTEDFEQYKELDTSRLDQWFFKDSSRSKHRNGFKLIISRGIDLRYAFLKRSAYKCKIEDNSFKALLMVHEDTFKLTLAKKLVGSTVGLPVLDKVKKIKMHFRVSHEQAEILKKVFPQFTLDELISNLAIE